MTLEAALNAWLTEQTGLPAYWLERASEAENAVVYRALTHGKIAGNLRRSGIDRDLYSISIYHQSPDLGLEKANSLANVLDDFSGLFAGYSVQLVSFNGGRDLKVTGESGQPQYLFVRDFIINH